MTRANNKGFTIIELLIATAIFSILLLVLSSALLQIGRIYYKGFTSSLTQETTRSILEDVSQTIQFAPGNITFAPPSGATPGYICIDTRRYTFVLGQQRPGTQHVLVADEVSGSCTGPQSFAGPLTASSRELLGDKMRLAKFDIAPADISNKTYRITIRVAYGDDDLLCSPTAPTPHCSDNVTMTSSDFNTQRDLECKDIRSGTQFCAISELSTIVERRLED